MRASTVRATSKPAGLDRARFSATRFVWQTASERLREASEKGWGRGRRQVRCGRDGFLFRECTVLSPRAKPCRRTAHLSPAKEKSRLQSSRGRRAAECSPLVLSNGLRVYPPPRAKENQSQALFLFRFLLTSKDDLYCFQHGHGGLYAVRYRLIPFF